MITSPQYKDRYREITCTARKITRYLSKHKEQLHKEVEEESSSSSANYTNDTDSKPQSPEKEDADEQSDIDLENMLENSVEKSDSEGNNVQKDVEPEELDKVMKTDNVQMDTEECIIGEVTKGVDNNMQKSKPSTSEENQTEDNKQDNDLEKLQNSTSDENQAEDKKEDDPLENEQPINASNDIREDNAEDMQVEQQSGNEDKNMEERIIRLMMINRIILMNRWMLIMCRKTVISLKDVFQHVAPMQAKQPTNFFRMLKARLKALGNSSISNLLKGQRQLSVLCVVSRIKPYKNWNYMYGENINHTTTNVHTAEKST